MPQGAAVPESRFAIACDVGGTELKFGSVQESEWTSCGRRPTPSSAAEFIETVVAGLRPLGHEPLPSRAGLALPGYLDTDRRRLLRSTHLSFLEGVAIADLIEAALGREVVLDTDTNAGAVAEARLGAGRDADRLLYISLGTGLGAALIERGRPVRVRRHTVGQIAEIPIDGKRAESLLGASGIQERYGARDAPAAIAQRAVGGEGRAREVWLETGVVLARLLEILCALWQPDAVVIGGGVSAAAPLFLPAARERLAASGVAAAREVRLEPARLLPWSGAIGAALLALDSPSRPS
jgi:glucokinase